MADMANDDKPDTADKEAPAEPTQPGVRASDTEVSALAGAATAAAIVAGHAHGAADSHGEDHGLAHTMPIWMLVAVLGALMALTVLTVSVTSYDLGSQGNLIVGMVIATIKAGLVVTFFMHLLWDKKFHLILFLTAVLFVVLFLSMSITDRGEYQPSIDLYQNTTSAAAK
jgi:cytochrome c oxidase subunit 4